MSSTGDQDYFSDGLSEEILNVLAKVKEMKVAGRTSSFKFKGKNDDLKKMGKELGVAHILEGSVRKSGNQIRVTAQLIKVSDGFHVWSDTYDYDYSAENLFKIQDEISMEVLKELKVKLLGESLKIKALPTKSTAAYEAFLKGNKLLRNRDPKDIEDAIIQFKRSIELDDKFALAYARLAIAYSHFEDYGSLDRKVAMKNIRDYADRAILLDNTLGEAYAALSFYYDLNREGKKLKDAIKKAYELESKNPEIIMWYAITFEELDEYDERMKLLHEAYEIDPLAPVLIGNLAVSNFRLKNFKKGEELLHKNIEINPEYLNSKRLLIDIDRQSPNGKLDKAFISAYKALKEHPDNLAFLQTLGFISLDLNLLFMSERVEKKMNTLYPENTATRWIHISNNFHKKVFDIIFKEREAYFDKVGITKDLDRRIAYEMNRSYHLNKYSIALDYINTYHPIYLSDTLTVLPYENHSVIEEVATLMKLNGELRVFNRLTTLYCDYTKSKFEYNGDITKEHLNTLEQMLNCAALKEDVETAIAIINETYFKRNKKTNTYGDLDMEYTLNSIKDSEAYKELRKKIQIDLDAMRANAVAFLKAEGDWPEGMEE
jgi:TolB-like protein/Tfp pilus assembly protein PilF